MSSGTLSFQHFLQAPHPHKCACQEVVSADMMIPEGRLQNLVEQALDRQLERCLYHNVRKPMVSLLSDYQCGREQIPSVVYQVSLLPALLNPADVPFTLQLHT